MGDQWPPILIDPINYGALVYTLPHRSYQLWARGSAALLIDPIIYGLLHSVYPHRSYHLWDRVRIRTS